MLRVDTSTVLDGILYSRINPGEAAICLNLNHWMSDAHMNIAL